MPEISELLKLYTYYEYETKDKLKYKLSGVDFKSFWEELTAYRKANSSQLDIRDNEGNQMRYVQTKKAEGMIKSIEEMGRDRIEKIIPEDIKHVALIESVIDEAFCSSVIEGAFSTRKRAGEMITQKLQPKNKSEMMILNNYDTLMYTLENLDEEIDHKFIHDIWEMITRGTLEEGDYTEGYRKGAVFVKNSRGDIVHEAPPADKVYEMMDKLISFINEYSNMNPVAKACIIHYAFVYIHPFNDGNGRTARALMNMFLIKSGYEFYKYFPISKILVDRRKQYYKAIKDCEDSESDITYFMDFYTKLLVDTIDEIRKNYLVQFSNKLIFDALEVKPNIIINKRQEKTLKQMIKSTRSKTSKSYIDISEYSKKHSVVQETARKDLNGMVDYGILKKKKIGKKYVYMLEDVGQMLLNIEGF